LFVFAVTFATMYSEKALKNSLIITVLRANLSIQ